jgi:hypothetical protein
MNNEPEVMSDTGAFGFGEERECAICEKLRVLRHGAFCEGCKAIFGSHLATSLCDEFDYVIYLKNGMEICCHRISLNGEWLEIGAEGLKVSASPFSFPRGLQVRLSEVVLVADAPDGS